MENAAFHEMIGLFHQLHWWLSRPVVDFTRNTAPSRLRPLNSTHTYHIRYFVSMTETLQGALLSRVVMSHTRNGY